MSVNPQLPLEPTVRIDPASQVRHMPGTDAVCECPPYQWRPVESVAAELGRTADSVRMDAVIADRWDADTWKVLVRRGDCRFPFCACFQPKEEE